MAISESTKGIRRCATVDGSWVSRAPAAWQLYNMEADRTEAPDLAHSEHGRVKAKSAVYEVGLQNWGSAVASGKASRARNISLRTQ